MTFAETLADLNEWHFFKEFIYSENTFRPTPQREVELADNLLWLGELLVIFQLKERISTPETTIEMERRWFEKKVLAQATRQVRDTLGYLKENSSIKLTNHRGHERLLESEKVRQLHSLVVYLPNPALPDECLEIKYHISKTAGLIHIIAAQDYLGIVRTLLTPAELADYLDFRSELIGRWGEKVRSVPETALVGQYLHGDPGVPPSQTFIDFLKTLEQRVDEWDMSGVVSTFPDRVTTNNAPTDYYPIIAEIASLKRNELREFRTRFQRSVEMSRANKFTRPYRIAVPRTDCGFVFIPLEKDMFLHRRNALLNLTQAHKYEQRLSKCIGVVIGNHRERPAVPH